MNFEMAARVWPSLQRHYVITMDGSIKAMVRNFLRQNFNSRVSGGRGEDSY